MPSDMNRRNFLRTASAAAAAVTIVPRQVLGGPGFVAPSEKITLAHIGFGSQSIREVGAILAQPEVQIVAVCDTEKDGKQYVEWHKGQLREVIRKLIDSPRWREGVDYAPGGRDVGKEVVETYYAKQRGADKYKGCATYVDYRELLEKEHVDAVKIMTPDHTHACIAMAAMKKGKHVIVHKPLANRVAEARLVIETARQTKVGTHFLPATDGARVRPALQMIEDGAIGAAGVAQLVVPADVAPVPRASHRHAADPQGF